MKSSYFSALLTGVFAIFPYLLSGCSESSRQDTLSLSEYELTFNASGAGERTVDVLTTSSSFRTSEYDSWITVTKGKSSFSVSVSEYTATDAMANDHQDRKSQIIVLAGTAEPVKISVTQTAPETEPDPEDPYLSLDPEELVFVPGETTLFVRVTGNVRQFSANIPEGMEWITDASVTGDILSVSVEKFVGKSPRSGKVEVVSDELAESVGLNITQYPEAPLDLSGKWSYSAKELKGGAYEDVTGDVEIKWNEELGGYVITPLVSNLASMEKDAEGGIIVEVDGQNNVTFTQGKPLGMWESFFNGMMSFAYHNYAGLIKSNLYESTDPYIEDGHGFILDASETRIAFPSLTEIDGEPYDYAFGFGGTGYDPDTGHDYGGKPSAMGLWMDLVLTKTE